MECTTLSLMTFHNCPQHCSHHTVSQQFIQIIWPTLSVHSFNQSEHCNYLISYNCISCSHFLIIHAANSPSPSAPSSIFQSSLESNLTYTALYYIITCLCSHCVYAILYVLIWNIYCVYALFTERFVTSLNVLADT